MKNLRKLLLRFIPSKNRVANAGRQRMANVNGTAAITNIRIIFKSIILMLLYEFVKSFNLFVFVV